LKIKWLHVDVTDKKINKETAHLQRAFIPVSRHVKVIKIHQDYPKLWSQMYCHLFVGYNVAIHIESHIVPLPLVKLCWRHHVFRLSIASVCVPLWTWCIVNHLGSVGALGKRWTDYILRSKYQRLSIMDDKNLPMKSPDFIIHQTSA